MPKISSYLDLARILGTEYIVSAFSGSNRKVKVRNAPLIRRERFPIHWTDFLETTQAEFMPWVSSGGAAWNKSASIANHPGIWSLVTAGAGAVEITNREYFFHGGEGAELVFRINTTGAIRFGFMDANVNPNGAWFAIDLPGFATGRCKNGGGGNGSTAGYALTAGVWYRAMIIVNDGATGAEFRIYDSSGTLLFSGTVSGVALTAQTGGSWLLVSIIAAGGANEDFDWMAYYLNKALTR